MRSTYTHLTEERTQRQNTATGTKSPEAVSRDKVTGGSQGTQNRHRRKPEATNDVEIYARSESRSSSRSISMAISSDSSEGDSGSSRGRFFEAACLPVTDGGSPRMAAKDARAMSRTLRSALRSSSSGAHLGGALARGRRAPVPPPTQTARRSVTVLSNVPHELLDGRLRLLALLVARKELPLHIIMLR